VLNAKPVYAGPPRFMPGGPPPKPVKAMPRRPRKRSRRPDESEEAMPAEQPEIIEAVRSAAIPISVQIDTMLTAVPSDVDLAEIATDLVLELEAICDRRDFIEIFTEAFAARQALVELGIQA
jgi:hypothetical protein